jgi:lactate racemase
MSDHVWHAEAQGPAGLEAAAVAAVLAEACPAADWKERRVLLVIPDGTRTAPVGLVFKTLHRQLGGVVSALDVLVALGPINP